MRVMRCERCRGDGWLLVPAPTKFGLPEEVPCPECGGSGIAHCCEGDQTQPGSANDYDDVDFTAAIISRFPNILKRLAE